MGMLDVAFNSEAARGNTVLTPSAFKFWARKFGLSLSRGDVDRMVSMREAVRLKGGLGAPGHLAAEARIAAYCRLQGVGFPAATLPPEAPSGANLGGQQAEAWATLARNRTVMLTGRPGTGKTYLAAAWIKACQDKGLIVDVCAPTGKAASVLASKLDDTPVVTIHRMLGINPHHFHTSHKTSCDVLVVDECSMIGARLMAALMKSVSKRTQLVLIGDPEQLPPVDEGRPFYDMVTLGMLPRVHLTEPQRQSGDSGILKMAYSVGNGEWYLPNKDVYHFNVPKERVLQESIDLYCSDRVINKFGVTDRLRQMMALVPVKDEKFEITTTAFNEAVSKRLLPQRDLGRSKFASGDRLIFTVNNYEHGFVNGEMGVLESFKHGVAKIRNDRDKLYTLEDYKLGKFSEWGYGLTVHKAQGSEVDIAIMMVEPSASHMYTRNNLYTALTRAKKAVIIVGPLDPLIKAVGTPDVRYTGLQELFSDVALCESIIRMTDLSFSECAPSYLDNEEEGEEDFSGF